MVSSPEAELRRKELAHEAPSVPRSMSLRTVWKGKNVFFLCGTLGAAFDAWHRRLSVTSAADAYLAQQIGLEAVEAVMDALEKKLRAEVEAEGRKLLPRRSPGYGDLPLELSREILERLDATRRIGVSITGSNLLVPSKSVTAICEIEG